MLKLSVPLPNRKNEIAATEQGRGFVFTYVHTAQIELQVCQLKENIGVGLLLNQSVLNVVINGSDTFILSETQNQYLETSVKNESFQVLAQYTACLTNSKN